jgi:multidrug efflux system membrane fusion protein
VTAGLKAGEVVVTEGGDRLRDGAQVQLPSNAPAPAAGAPAAGAQPPGKPGAAATPGGRRGKGRGKPPPSP